MAKRSRREFLKEGITLATVTSAAPATVAGGSPEYEMRSTARAPWTSVRVLETEKMPWENLPGADDISRKYQYRRKLLFLNPETKAHIMITYRYPGWPGAPVHYHSFHEWGYMLSGDTTNNES